MYVKSMNRWIVARAKEDNFNVKKNVDSAVKVEANVGVSTDRLTA